MRFNNIVLFLMLIFLITGCSQKNLTSNSNDQPQKPVTELLNEKKVCTTDTQCAMGEIVLVGAATGSIGCFNREYIIGNASEDRCGCYNNVCSGKKNT